MFHTWAWLLVENPFVKYDCMSNTTLGQKKTAKSHTSPIFFWSKKNRKGSYFVVLKENSKDQLGDNCIQNLYLGRYLVGYTVGNLVLKKILNMVIPILMHFCSFVSNPSVASPIMGHVTQRNVTYLMTSNCFLQYIAEYTVANVWGYPIRRRVTKASALEYLMALQYVNSRLNHACIAI